jgi:hypothetical protein
MEGGMVRSTGEVQADIALTRRAIEHELDVLHRRLPKRRWLSYVWLASGLAIGVVVSRAPFLTVVNQGLRLAQFGASIMATVAMIDNVLAQSRQRRHRAFLDPSKAGVNEVRR